VNLSLYDRLLKRTNGKEILLKGGYEMKQVRNADGKLVCQVDNDNRSVEIVRKGFKTTVRFTADKRVKVENTRPAV